MDDLLEKTVIIDSVGMQRHWHPFSLHVNESCKYPFQKSLNGIQL
jgi:GH35 family endo-1,4-beta-xylanase